MYKKITYISLFIFLLSCSESFDSVKRGLTGAKKQTGEEFLVKKKDPLILPPDYENLPVPDERNIIVDDESIFEKTLEGDEIEGLTDSKSVEFSILKKIKSK